MNLQELAAQGPKRVVGGTAKIVTLDIERFKGRAEIEFWSLNDYKGRRIHANDVVEWPRTICLAWRTYGLRRVEFSAEWQDGGREAMLRKAWDIYDEADIIVGHNVAAFDSKNLQGEWLELGLPLPRPFKTVDTLSIARRVTGYESRTLDAMCKRLGIPAKTDAYDVEVARAAIAGDRTAQNRLRRYNVGDIEASEALYDRLRGYIPNHPHVGTFGEEPVCNQCGGKDLTRQVSTYRAVVIDYILYRCDNCGANVRGGWHSRSALTRGAR